MTESRCIFVMYYICILWNGLWSYCRLLHGERAVVHRCLRRGSEEEEESRSVPRSSSSLTQKTRNSGPKPICHPRRVASWVNYSSRRTESSSGNFASDLSLLKADAPWCENNGCSDSNPWPMDPKASVLPTTPQRPISLSYHISVVLPSHFSFMEQMLMLMLTYYLYIIAKVRWRSDASTNPRKYALL